MTNAEERLFMLDLAIVQLIAGILVTLGSTLLAISIGFGLSIPTDMQEAIFNIMAMRGNISPELQQTLIEESLTNYVLVVALVGIILIIVGVIFASGKIKKIRKQIKKERNIRDLIATDIVEMDSTTDRARQADRSPGLPEPLAVDNELLTDVE